MRLRAISLALAVALGSVSVASLAQNETGPASATPEQDIQCALWASVISGSSEDEQVKEAYAYALNFFLGRYEAASGEDFRPAMTAAAEAADADFALLEAQDEPCSARWEEYLERLDQWGSEGLEAEAFETFPFDGEPTA